jgi:hypothetical protein
MNFKSPREAKRIKAWHDQVVVRISLLIVSLSGGIECFVEVESECYFT